MPYRFNYNPEKYNNLTDLIYQKEQLEEELYVEDDFQKRLNLQAEIDNLERMIRNRQRREGYNPPLL